MLSAKKELMKIYDIFKSTGVPETTYIERENGQYEDYLKEALYSKGKICLLTGLSKTGKTTLYEKVLSTLSLEKVVVRCNDGLTVDDFWESAFEVLDSSRIKQIEKSNEIGTSTEGQLGANVLLVKGQAKIGLSGKSSKKKIYEKVLSKVSAIHLAQTLKDTNKILVIEDFHYLTPPVQKSIFQMWKVFIDEEVSALMVGTSSHKFDLTFENKDLSGRIYKIELPPWSNKDLANIVYKGFNYLGLTIDNILAEKIATESVGLPIITQQICLQIFTGKGVFLKKDINQTFNITEDFLNTSIISLIKKSYSFYQAMYSILANGIRKSRSKYKTYEVLLFLFSLDPVTFSLSRDQLLHRVSRISLDKKPTVNSIDNTLRNLKKHQKNHDLDLLEWLPNQNTLYIVEPGFLFYLRWRVFGESTGENESLYEFFNRLKEEKIFVDSKTFNDIMDALHSLK